MKRCRILSLLCIFYTTSVTAQNVGIGTTTPNPSAQLDINSTNKGILIPRLTTIQRDAISLPAEGLMIYNTTDSTFYVFKTRWRKMGITLPYTDTVAHNQYGVNIVNTGGGTALRGTATTNFTTAVSGTSASFGIGVSGSSVDGGSGVSGQSSGLGSGVSGSNPDANGNGVYGQSSGSGTGVYGNSLFGTGGKFNSTFGTALMTNGPVKMNGSLQLQGMGEATGRVLQSDANGNASWNVLSRLYSISIPAASFVAVAGNGDRFFPDNGEVTTTTGTTILEAPVIVPNGATITSIFFHVKDVVNDREIVGKMIAYANGSNVAVESASNSSGMLFMGGYTSFNIPMNHVVNTALYSYVVRVYALSPVSQSTWNGGSLEAVNITYTINLN